MGEEANETKMVQFELFPRLPKEIRLKIWEHAIEPRIVEIWQKPHYEPKAPQNGRETSEDESNNEETSQETHEKKEEEESSSTSAFDAGSAPPAPIITQPVTDNDSEKSSDSDPDDEDADKEEEDEPINPNPFTSPTPVPPILHTTQESRLKALKHYTPPFPISASQPQIFYNAAIDILYFPPWCFESSIFEFERWISDDAKGRIRKVAIELLVWYSYVEDGSINSQIQISKFKGLEELYLVSRNPDELGCGCCHEFEEPESGVLSFETNPREPVEDVDEVDGEDEEDGEEGRRKGNRRTFRDLVVEGVEDTFSKIRERDSTWRTPELKFVKVMRDGVEV